MGKQKTPTPESLRLRQLAISKRNVLHQIMDKYGATEMSIFGSVAQGTAHKDSDIDLLVDTIKTPGLFAMTEFLLDLQDTLDTDVDLVVSGYIKQNRVKSIFSGEMIRI